MYLHLEHLIIFLSLCCVDSLFGKHKPGLSSIRQMDDKSRLIYPSVFVVKIVKFAEKIINVELQKDKWLQKYYFDKCNLKICNNFVSLYGDGVGVRQTESERERQTHRQRERER